MDAAFALAEEALDTKYEALSERVVKSVQSLLTDSLVTAVGGLHAEGVDATRTALGGCSGVEKATVWGTDVQESPFIAAFLNAASLHALEFDDTDDGVPLHPSSVVLPVLFASCDAMDVNLSGEEFLTSLAVGLEMTMRIGRAGRVGARRGWNFNAMNGGFGAVLAVARARKMTVRDAVSSMGHQLSQTAGTTQSLTDGVLAKRLQPAFMAKAAVMSCAMTEAGIDGSSNVLEGKSGYYALYQDGDYDVESLRPRSQPCSLVEGVSLKPYPSCRFTHPSIDAALRFADEGFDLSMIGSVDILVSEVAARLVGAPFDPVDSTVVDAQFSIPYTVATALGSGAVRLQDFTETSLRRKDIGVFAGSKVNVVADLSLPPTALLPATVTINLKDGSSRTERIEVATGSPQRPMTPEQRRLKEEDCLREIDSSNWLDDLHRCIANLTDGATFEDLSRIMRETS